MANLTRREQEVALLVAEGLTNRDIASRLFISERTAESHVEQIRGKLGFHSRAQVAAWVVAGGLEGGAEVPSAPVALPAATARARRRLRPALSVAVIAVVAASAALVVALELRQKRPSTESSAGGTLVTVAGTGARAFSNDGGSASSAALVRPVAVALGAAGEVYVAEGNRVREVRPDGRITTLAGTGTAGSGGDGGQATMAQLNAPQGLAVDSAGNVYIADTLNNRVRRVSPAGVITTVAGTGEPGYSGDGKAADQAQLNLPSGLAMGFSDSLFIADTGNNVVRERGADETIRTVAGTGEGAYRGDGGPAAYAAFHAPGGLAFDNEGNLFIADTLNERVRRVGADGQVSTVAGTGDTGRGGDRGPGIFAELNLANNPLEGMGQGLAVGPSGELVIADALNHEVKRLDLNGLLTTIAVTSTPLGVAVDPQGAVYIADGGDNRVKKLG